MYKMLLVFFLFSIVINTYPTEVEAISAASYCVIETHSGHILYESNARTRRGMASTTKIMTAIVALESGKTDEYATVSQDASRTEGSSLYLKAGEKMRVYDLVCGLMLNSGNDAAVVLAEHIGGDVKGFVNLMNEKASALGLTDTHFVNANGLSDDMHYTTAYDLARITAYALQNPSFREIVSMQKKTVATTEGRCIYLSNHNKLLRTLDGCDGVKTGFTKATGRCLVSSVTRNSLQTVCVTLHAPDDWDDHSKLHNRAHSEYALIPLVENGAACGVVNIKDGATESVEGILAESVNIVQQTGAVPNKKIETKFEQNLTAPVLRGEKIGEAIVYADGTAYKRVDIIANRTVEKLCKLSYWDAFHILFEAVFCL